MGGNSTGGNYRTRPDLIWRAFDKLPPEVRRALSEAIVPRVPQPFVTMLRKGATPAACIARIKSWDAEDIVDARSKIWGDDLQVAVSMAWIQGRCAGLSKQVSRIQDERRLRRRLQQERRERPRRRRGGGM